MAKCAKKWEDVPNARLNLNNLRQTFRNESFVIDIVGGGKLLYLWFGTIENGYMAHIDNKSKLRKWVKELNKRLENK